MHKMSSQVWHHGKLLPVDSSYQNLAVSVSYAVLLVLLMAPKARVKA